MNDKVFEQIMEIRDEGNYNMFDVKGIQRKANEKGFYELVIFLEEHKKEYCEFIMTGNR